MRFPSVPWVSSMGIRAADPGRCPSNIDLSRFVDGESTRNEEAVLATHFAGCLRCRVHVDQLRLVISDLARTPDVGDLDLAPLVMQRATLPPRRRSVFGPILGGMVLATAALGAVLIAPRFFDPGRFSSTRGSVMSAAIAKPVDEDRSISDRGFVARGRRTGADSWIAIRPFRVEGKGSSELPRDRGVLHARDAMLLGYDNGGPEPYQWISVFAVENTTHGRSAHWLYPEAPRDGATAVRIEPGVGRQLPDELRLPLHDGGRLKLVAVFSHEPPSRLQLETFESSLGEAASLAARPVGAGVDLVEIGVGGDGL